jgi:RNA polymerase primary sigma factor
MTRLESSGQAVPPYNAADVPVVNDLPTEDELRINDPVAPDVSTDAASTPEPEAVDSDEEVDSNPSDLDEEAGAPADPVRVYLNAIGRTPLLSAEEEVELAKRIEAGVYAEHRLRTAGEDELSAELVERLQAVAADGRTAKAHMLRANLRLVVSIAKRFSHRGVPFLDVIQEGNLGLIRAVEKFDYTKGFKFSTYATWWIRQAIGRGLAEQARIVRLPVHVNEVLAKLARAERDLARDLGRPATEEELAAALDVPVERVVELRRVRRDPVSLDLPIGDDGETSIGDLVLDEEASSAADVVERQALTEQLDAALSTLSPREARILRLRFGLTDGRARTLDEIGRDLGLTRERVRQLEKLALAHLRRAETRESLLDWAS